MNDDDWRYDNDDTDLMREGILAGGKGVSACLAFVHKSHTGGEQITQHKYHTGEKHLLT